MVLSILGASDVHLVESNRRKTEFLNEVKRQTGASVTIHHHRAETLEPWPVDVITARAVAPVDRFTHDRAPPVYDASDPMPIT